MQPDSSYIKISGAAVIGYKDILVGEAAAGAGADCFLPQSTRISAELTGAVQHGNFMIKNLGDLHGPVQRQQQFIILREFRQLVQNLPIWIDVLHILYFE